VLNLSTSDGNRGIRPASGIHWWWWWWWWTQWIYSWDWCCTASHCHPITPQDPSTQPSITSGDVNWAGV